ncbi:MAG: tyrosine-type recombinase/integrase [Candidatus Hadarchaeia archaeon]
MIEKLEKMAKNISESETGFDSEVFLTEEDISELIKATDSTRDRALLSLLWETGARISELYDLKKSDLKEGEYGTIVSIDGYTGAREIPVFKSASILKEWLKEHRQKSESRSYLWIKGDGKNIEKISYNYIRKTIKELLERAGIDKIADISHIRQSRAAFLAKWLDEEEMKYWFGWQEESDITGIMQGCSSCAGCPFSCKAR